MRIVIILNSYAYICQVIVIFNQSVVAKNRFTKKSGPDFKRSHSIKNKSRKKIVVTTITNICFHLFKPFAITFNLSFTSKQYLKPWLDVHCIFITTSLKSQMKTDYIYRLNMGPSQNIFKELEYFSHARQRIIIAKKGFMQVVLEVNGAKPPPL